jgi:putative two-component system response regulator
MPSTSLPTILIVDDMPENLTVLSDLLLSHYQVRVANSGQKALRIINQQTYPDLILLDVMMPDLDGYQVFEILRANPETRNIPVIFVTAMNSVEAELHALDAGAVDYITKPIIAPIVLARVRTQLELKQARDRLSGQNTWLETEIARRMAENELTQEVSIRALAHLAEIRDPETGLHILRTQAYVQQLATHLQSHQNFAERLTPRYVKLLGYSAPLHDIGKVGIPDSILLKSGPLNETEWKIMQTHTTLGSEAIELAERDTAESAEFLSLAKEIARWHHEKWDGSGYPDGLMGENIPLSARIMALADVFDALISQRTYKPPMPYPQARKIIETGQGFHFDPLITEQFLQHFNDFCDIADRYREPDKDRST